jgi:hypothetical protein
MADTNVPIESNSIEIPSVLHSSEISVDLHVAYY